jgi:hypothetical protein
MNKFPVMASLIAWFLSGLVHAADPPKAVNFAELGKAKVTAAQRTYELLLRNFRESRPPIAELPYRWSCRWLDAQRELSNKKEDEVAAYQAHRERMRDLHRVIKDRFRERYVSVDEETAGEFYLLEAEIWLARAREK